MQVCIWVDSFWKRKFEVGGEIVEIQELMKKDYQKYQVKLQMLLE